MATTHLTVVPSLRDAWGEWLGHRPWDLFVTLTSERRTHPEALLKRFRYCTHKIADHLYGRHWDRRTGGPEFVVGMERHRSGWPHSHAVLRLPSVDMSDPLQFNLAHWQEFITDTGGFCHLARPRNQDDVVGYCTKYVLKEGDLTLSDNLNPYESADQLALLTAPPKRLHARAERPRASLDGRHV